MPQLAIDFRANFAQVLDGLDQINRRGKKTADTLEREFASIKSLGAGLFAGLSTAAVVQSFNQTISLMSSFKSGAEQAGTSIEKFSGLFYDLRDSAIPVETLTDATAKLVRAMQNIEEPGSLAGEAFKKLGITIKDSSGNLRDSTAVLRDVANALAQYEDGANKVSLAQALFGRTGSSLLPVLKDLAEVGETAAGVTEQQAVAADTYEKSINRLNAGFERLRIQIFGALLDPLTEVIKRFNDAQEAGLGFLDSLKALDRDITGKFLDKLGVSRDNAFLKAIGIDADAENKIKSLGEELAGLERQLKNIESGDTMFQFSTADEVKKKIAGVRKELEALQRVEAAAIARQFGGGEGFDFGFGATKPQAPSIAKPTQAKATKAARETEGQRILDQLDKQLANEQKLTEYEQAHLDISKALRKDKASVTAAQEELILSTAQLLDAQKQSAEIAKTEADLRKIIDAAESRQADRIRDKAKAYEELGDPVRKYREQLTEIYELEQAGALGTQVADSARNAVIKDIKDLEDKTGKTKELKSAAEQLGLTFSSAFEDAALSGKSLSKVLQGLAQDIAKIVLRKTITEPLANSLTGILDVILGGGGGTGVPSSAPGTTNLRALEGGGDAVYGSASGGKIASGGQTINLYGSGVTMQDVSRAVRVGNAETQGNIMDQQRRSGGLAYG